MSDAVEKETPRRAADELRRAADELERTAWVEGIEPGSPLGTFVSAQKHALTKQANMVESFEKMICAKVDLAHQTAVVELSNLKVGLRQAIELQEHAKQAVLIGQVRREDLVAQALKDHWPELVQALKPWLVWRETRFNFREKWRTALAASAVVICVAIAAYSFRAWQDEAATAALARCVSSGLRVSSADGKRVCYLDQLFPTETSPTAWFGWAETSRQAGR
jgi:hypothetical protein